MRLTVEQDVIFPFIPNDKVEEMKKEPIFQKYPIDAGNLTRGLVSCTGAQVGGFCGPLLCLRRLAIYSCVWVKPDPVLSKVTIFIGGWSGGVAEILKLRTICLSKHSVRVVSASRYVCLQKSLSAGSYVAVLRAGSD